MQPCRPSVIAKLRPILPTLLQDKKAAEPEANLEEKANHEEKKINPRRVKKKLLRAEKRQIQQQQIKQVVGASKDSDKAFDKAAEEKKEENGSFNFDGRAKRGGDEETVRYSNYREIARAHLPCLL